MCSYFRHITSEFFIQIHLPVNQFFLWLECSRCLYFSQTVMYKCYLLPRFYYGQELHGLIQPLIGCLYIV